MTSLRIHRFAVILLCLSLYGCRVRGIEGASQYLAQALASRIAPGRTLAVVGIFDVDAKTAGRFHDALAENLTTDLKLASAGRYALVGRRLIAEAMGELNFQMSDLVDRNVAVRVGKFVGADGVVSGTAEKVFPGVYRVNVRAFDVETLKILAVARSWASEYVLLIYLVFLVVLAAVLFPVFRKIMKVRIEGRLRRT